MRIVPVQESNLTLANIKYSIDIVALVLCRAFIRCTIFLFTRRVSCQVSREAPQNLLGTSCLIRKAKLVDLRATKSVTRWVRVMNGCQPSPWREGRKSVFFFEDIAVPGNGESHMPVKPLLELNNVDQMFVFVGN